MKIFAVVVCLIISACGTVDAPEICAPELPALRGIVGGAVDVGRRYPCVVRLDIEKGPNVMASGVVIGRKTILTVRHAVGDARVVRVTGLDQGERVGRSGTITLHPSLDLALVHFWEPLGLPVAELSTRPIADLIGLPAEIVGFGQDTINPADQRRKVGTGVVSHEDAGSIIVDEKNATHHGDSGGGVFVGGELVGIHVSTTSARIDGADHYFGRSVDVFAASDWVLENL